MAKRKGKSQRRIRDWQLRQIEQESTSAGSRRAKLTQRAVKLPPWRLEAPAENLEDLPKEQGMVVALFPGGAIVRTDARELLCGLAGTFRAPEGSSALAVGDQVSVALTRPEHADQASAADKGRTDGMILLRQPRRTVLARPQPRSGKRRDEYAREIFEKVIAANMDVLLIVASTRQPPLRESLVDRFLIIAERGGLAPLLAVNKVDLAPPEAQALEGFGALGLDAILTSAVTGQGIEQLRRSLAGRSSVLAGASGVGKSTLINALVPGAQAATREVRLRDERGRHTTTSAAVYDLPGGGMIVDTPGVRELGVHLEARELPWYFPEFEPCARQCRFSDCTHTHEPGCAVVGAVSGGGISARRYESYLRIRQSLEEFRR